MDGWTLPLHNLDGNPAPVMQVEGWVPQPVLTGAENLVPTLGFNPQIFQPVASLYTHVVIAYKGSRYVTPLKAQNYMQSSGWLHGPAGLIRGQYPLTECWVGPRAGLVVLE